jgi:hypothetical protein
VNAPTPLEVDLERLAERLRTAPLRKVEPATDEVRALLQRLAELAQGIDERASGTEPVWRGVPELPVAALGDQVTVLAHDLRAALHRVDAAAQVPTPAGPAPVGEALAALEAQVKAVRARI